VRTFGRIGLLCLGGVAAAFLGIVRAGAAPAAPGQAIWVAPTGDDNNPGTEDKPIRTLAHARDLVRTRASDMSADLTVYLHGGTYRLAEPLVFDARDSGTNGHRVIYTVVQGEHPVLSGGVAITGWKLADAGRNLWSAPVPAGVTNSRQLYVNGVRAFRAAGLLPVKLTQTPSGYTADSDVMSKWRNPTDIEFVYTGGNTIWSNPEEGLGSWTEPRISVAKIEGTRITMAQPCWDNSTKRVMLPPDSKFKRTANLVGPASVGKEPAFVENAFELLNTPGQWYFDRPAKTIYYMPRPGEDLARADVEIPVLESLIEGRGTPEKPIHDITFAGIQFSYATWLGPCTGEGFSEIQANYCVTGPNGYALQGLCKLAPGGTCPYGNWTKIPGNVSIDYGTNIQFTRDAFTHLGAAGLNLGDGSQSDLVEGCVFTDISGNGLELGGVDLPLGTGPQITRDNRIANNHVYDVAAEYHGGIGICVGYAQRTHIEHNQIDHQPYAGISIGWGGWPDKIEQPGQPNYSQNNVIAHNLIFDHMLVLSDGGGIYNQGLTGTSIADGLKVLGNVVRDQYSSGHAIYTDNGSAYVTVAGNVMFHTNHDNWASAHAFYYNGETGTHKDPTDIENNYWQQGESKPKPYVVMKGNRLISSLDQVPASILNDAGLQSKFKDIVHERFAIAVAPEPPSRIGAAAGDGCAYVSWSPPRFEGGAAVESYTVIPSKGERVTVPAAEFLKTAYVKVPGLSNGSQYTFTVTATNANGTSSPSMPTPPITVGQNLNQKLPAPATVSAYPGDGMASVHFQAPDVKNPGAILAYAITVHPGGRKVMVTGRQVLTLSGKHATFAVVDGLKNGQSYTFEVTAVNEAGEGEAASTRPVKPTAAPASVDEPH
jgi:hypothetical protein